MRIDPVECRENAMKCRKLATETTDLSIQKIELAHCWDRLAIRMADTNELVEIDPRDRRAAWAVMSCP